MPLPKIVGSISQAESLQLNIACRKAAESIIELAESEAFSFDSTEHQARFWQELISAAQVKLPPVPNTDTSALENEPMTDNEAAEFERELMPRSFTAFALEVIRDVPQWYINSLLDSLSFVKQLRRYSMSRRFRDRANQ